MTLDGVRGGYSSTHLYRACFMASKVLGEPGQSLITETQNDWEIFSCYDLSDSRAKLLSRLTHANCF